MGETEMKGRQSSGISAREGTNHELRYWGKTFGVERWFKVGGRGEVGGLRISTGKTVVDSKNDQLWNGSGPLTVRPEWKRCLLNMALLGPTRSLPFSLPFKHPSLRLYATVNSPLIIAKPPNLPPHTSLPRPLDSFILETLARAPSAGRTALPQLIQQYLRRSGNVLDAQLPYEPRPSPSRRVSFSTDTGHDVHLIVHVARENDRSKVTVSSGFALETTGGVPILVTCAHTLEEVCRLP